MGWIYLLLTFAFLVLIMNVWTMIHFPRVPWFWRALQICLTVLLLVSSFTVLIKVISGELRG